ncbi:hypothetical protein AA309_23890 [Microvirga vignae]|uniref:Helix-hairpin-helix domain-containing protein n=1 Tax=Microvirga vignae TaxID=1225564 RepID=A0A0H1R6Q9_9HYPH|nr:hypothetical protein AA309_23890 [Microvirga vignae]
MPNPYFEDCRGPIAGLRLPYYVWRALEKQNIMTIHQLNAAANQIERSVPGIGTRAAKAIRAELARVAASKKAV